MLFHESSLPDASGGKKYTKEVRMLAGGGREIKQESAAHGPSEAMQVGGTRASPSPLHLVYLLHGALTCSLYLGSSIFLSLLLARLWFLLHIQTE
jgi:hypothetical protein